MTLAIAGNTIVFSIINGMLYRPLPFEEPARLTILTERARDLPRGQIEAVSALNFLDWRERQTSFEALAAFRPTTLSVDNDGRTEHLAAGSVTPGFFTVLGSTPVRGRTFLPEEGIPGRHRVALLSHRFYLERYPAGSDPTGETLTMNGEPYDIVGVLDENFEFVDPTIRIYVPLPFERAELRRHQRDLIVIARLADTVSGEQAQAEMSAIMTGLEEEHPEANRGYALDVLNLREEIPDPRNRMLLQLIQGALVFVLLIACANVANILLARGQSREREIAIRTSIGATRGRIVRQLFTESMVMALFAGVLALVLAAVGVKVLASALASQLPQFYLPVLDGRVLLFNLAVTLLGGVLFGIAPVTQTHRFDLLAALKEGTQGATVGSRRRLVSNTLVIAELALALVFLAGASIMINSISVLHDTDPGFTTENLLTAQIALSEARYGSDGELVGGAEQLIERFTSLPGVRAVTASNALPRTPLLPRGIFTLDDRPTADGQPPPRAAWLAVYPGFFTTLGIELVEGRSFTAAVRRDTTPVAVVNEAMAGRYWATGTPLGRHLVLQGRSWEIVGIVRDARHGLAINNDLAPTIYVPWTQLPTHTIHVAIRTETEPSSLSRSLRDESEGFDPTLTITRIETLDAIVEQFWVGQNIIAVILRVFGFLALILAIVGTYGVLAYSVAQRVHEIGIRMAVGAGRRQVELMIIRQGFNLAALGILVGIPGVVLVSRALAGILHDIVAVDSTAVIVVVAGLTMVVMIASFLPARRAARVDPIRALRNE